MLDALFEEQHKPSPQQPSLSSPVQLELKPNLPLAQQHALQKEQEEQKADTKSTQLSRLHHSSSPHWLKENLTETMQQRL